MLGPELLPIYQNLLTRRPGRVIALSSGFHHYQDYEPVEYKKIAKDFALIFTRDTETFEALKDSGPCSDSIDLGFFVKHFFTEGIKGTNQIVVSVDYENTLQELETLVTKEELPRVLQIGHIRECQHTRSTDVFLPSEVNSLVRVYAGAEKVITSRVHGTVLALTFGKPGKFLNKSQTGRAGLLDKVGIPKEQIVYSPSGRIDSMELTALDIKPKINAELKVIVDKLKQMFGS